MAVSDAAYDAVNAIESSASRCFASLHLKIGLYTILRANSRFVLLCSAVRLSDTLAWIPSRLQQRHVLISYPSMETTCVDKNLGAVLVVRQALLLERSFVDAGFIQTEDQHGLFVDTKGDRCAANEARILVIRAGDSISRQQQHLDTLRTAVLEGQTLILHGADCLSPLLNDLVTRLLQLSMPHVLMWFPSKVPNTPQQHQQFSTSVVSSPYRIYHEKECDHNHITSYRRSKRGDGETRGRMIAVSQYFRLIVFAPHAWLETHPSQQQPTVMRLHANAWAPMIVPQDSLIKEFLEKEGAQETQSQPHPKDYASSSVSAFLPTFRDPSLSYINFDRDLIDHLVIHPDSLRDVRSFLHMYLIFHIRNEVLTYLEKLLPRADRDDDTMNREGREDPTGRMRETAKEVLKLLASYWKLYHERSDPGSPLLWIMLLHRFYFLRQKNRNKMSSSSSASSPSAPLMRDCRLELLNLYSLDYTETSRTGEMLLMVPQELFA